ncbi:glyceraldehyde-3-phosphate dehydrogenase [Moraxella macacae 0408225]|uniref:Glyceraldehyde-3-phosphate dehydrogenase n=1 Tax=Moraxella macacae 0408225 TaxID=1230338 RepID=L2F6H8_9GAMM|nr:type I glyceraldehyde-3-phosphate dehydrogenase [Moraxella macacae]ELA08515.1 glyceraldehyde-3-phosphate dehydrogenase [Moraxella macacae 0408225]
MQALAINGFGRIGRNVLRAYLQRLANNCPQNFCIVAINDVASADVLLHLLKYDSTHGRLNSRFDVDICLNNNQFNIKINGQVHVIHVLQQADPKNLNWRNFGVDIVLESTGYFRSYNNAYQHIYAGARQVIIGSAPFDTVDASVVIGVNDYELSRDKAIVSGVSCTTQALVPLLAVLDKAFGVKNAMLTEIHAVTADQNVLDQVHRDLRRARAAGFNIIPTTSSSIGAVERVLPSMQGKINGHSLRVPTLDVASIDVAFVFDKLTDVCGINQVLKQASEQELFGIMGYTDEPLVSSDFVHEPYSLIIDSLQTMSVGVGDSKQFKVFAWYDNEWGYANRMLDMCQKLS